MLLAGDRLSYRLDGVSPSGKAPGFDPGMRRFESCHPSHFRMLFERVGL